MGVDGTTVIVTGGARGIGRYIAKTYARAGAKLVIADLSPMDNVVGELTDIGADAIGVTTDITDEKAVQHLVEVTYARHGRIDTLINNAAIVPHFQEGAPRWPRVRDMRHEFFAKVIDVNLIGTFLCCKHVIPYMEALSAGHIINLGQGNLSPSSAPPVIGHCAYGTSKVAIRAFTKFLAEETREFGVCVVSMGPRIAKYAVKSSPTMRGEAPGIITEDSPEWTRDPTRGLKLSMTVDDIGDCFLLAADAPMEFSGSQITIHDGELVVATD